MGNGYSPLSYCDAPGQGADPLMQAMMICGDHNMDRIHHAIYLEHELKMDSLDGFSSGAGRQLRPVPEEPRAMRLEALVRQLFNLQDANADGVLEEAELALLNDKIARLRRGTTGRALFRDRLDKFGRPVPYATFRKYVLQILQELDSDEAAQEILLEQFVAETMGRGGGFRHMSPMRYRAPPSIAQSIAQAPYMPVAPRRISFMPVAPCRMGLNVSRGDARMQMVTL